MKPLKIPHPAPQLAGSAPERILAPCVEEILPQLCPKLQAWPRTAEMVRYCFHVVLTHADKDDGLAAVNARTFCRVTGRRHGHAILNQLVDLGYLASDGKYCAGKFSKHFKLGVRAKGLPLLHHDAAPDISRRLRQLRTNKVTEALGLSPEAQVVFTDLSRFSLELDQSVEAILAWCRAERPRSEPFYRLAIDQLARGHHFLVRCVTGRLFHNLASMPKKLRPLLKVDGAPCAEVDIAAAQPTLLISFYPAPSMERTRYADMIQTGCYEYLIREIALMTGERLSRDTVKQQWLKEVFGLDWQRRQVWAILTRDFPLLCRVMDEMRADDYCETAHRLQRLEANLVIGQMVPRIKQVMGNVGISTVHDSLLCPRLLAESVAVIMREVLVEALGVEPLLRIT
jgi:hypothetical protein